jgi:carbohydrate-selective porin OprB
MSRHKSHELLTKRNLLLALVAVLTTTTSRAQDQQWLLGDWNGKRQALTEEGFEFDFVLTVEGVQNVAGGIARSSRGLANLDLIMDAQGKALGLSENGDLHLYLLGNCGGAPTDMIGDIQTTSNIEAPNTIKVYEAWWRQRHDEDSIAWLVGWRQPATLRTVLSAYRPIFPKCLHQSFRQHHWRLLCLFFHTTAAI